MVELVEIPAVEQDLRCPLCEYNLRGLTEPRCPECGAAFDWDEVRDPSRRLHPYLFEHHPERDVSSFLQTLRGGPNPRRFWTTLFPTQPSRPRRLLMYWVICILLGSLSVLVQLVFSGQMLQQINQSERARTLLRAQKNPGLVTYLVRDYGSVQAFCDLLYPQFPSPEFFKQLVGAVRSSAWSPMGLPLVEGWGMRLYVQIVFMLLWPPTVVVVLMLLRATMRRAQVRRIHLMRVAIYSGDAAVVSGALLLLLTVLESFGKIDLGRFDEINVSTAWLALAAIVLTWRLSVAIARYLRFLHAFPTALAVQIVFGLVVMKLYMMLIGY
jgi:hypothetical protein